jgi:hypothetical protein
VDAIDFGWLLLLVLEKHAVVHSCCFAICIVLSFASVFGVCVFSVSGCDREQNMYKSYEAHKHNKQFMFATQTATICTHP